MANQLLSFLLTVVESTLKATQHVGDALSANIVPFLEEAAKQDENFGTIAWTITVMGIASIFPTGWLNEPVPREPRRSAALSRLKLVSSMLSFLCYRIRLTCQF